MWATIGAVALITWLVVAAGTIAVVFVRQVWARGLPDPLPDHAADAVRLYEGRMPPTPLLEWVNWCGDDSRPASR